MAASTTDKFKKVGASTVTTLSAPGKALAATSINVGSTTNYPTDTGIVIAIRTVDSNGELVAGTYTEWAATVSSATSFAIDATPVYGSDQIYAAGSTTQVYIPASSKSFNDTVDGLLIEHKQTGAHSAVTADSIVVSGTSSLNGALTVKSYDGWITETRTWTYASGATTNVGTFTVAGVDLTGVYNVGDRVKFTQTTVKYGIITKVAFSTDTTVTIYMGTDYTIANAAITSPAYSHDRSPAGFPMDPAKWTVEVTNSNDCTKTTTVNGTWYGDTGLSSTGPSITIPIGSWRVYYECIGKYSVTSVGGLSVFVSLSTSASSESDTGFTTMSQHSPGNNLLVTPLRREKTVTLASSTVYYLVTKTQNSGSGSSLSIYGSSGATTVIRAICAYL